MRMRKTKKNVQLAMLLVLESATVPHSVDFVRQKLRRETYGGFSVDEVSAYRWLCELCEEGALTKELVRVGREETEWQFSRAG